MTHTTRYHRLLMLLLMMVCGLTWPLLAQESEPDRLFVTITRLDSQNFPQMEALVSVVDESGLPVSGLTEADFAVLEDKLPADPESITVSPDESSELRVVMALDLSMPVREVELMKTATLGFIDSLGARDQMSLMTFSDEIVSTQDFTANKGRLREFVERLEPEGNFTTLHEVVIEATNKVSQFPIGRRAVVIITNSGDNINELYTAEEAIAQARQQKVPLYVVGLQTLNGLPEFQQVSEETGGQSYLVEQSDQVEDVLAALKDLLRSGYRIGYLSNLVPDDEAHDIQVVIKRDGQTISQGNPLADIPPRQDGQPEPSTSDPNFGSDAPENGTALPNSATDGADPPQQTQTGNDTVSFTAARSEIALSLLGVHEGQTVTGLVNLLSQVTAPAPGITVTYQLDGRRLGQATEPPYSVEWNTNVVPPGEHTLRVTAIDQAGNTGELSVQVRLPQPVAVTLVTQPRLTATLGTTISLEAQLVSLTEIERVDFLFNERPLGSDLTPPYQLQFVADEAIYQAGSYQVEVIATDRLGGQDRTRQTINLVKPTGISWSWWQQFLTFIRAPYPLFIWSVCLAGLLPLLLLPFMLLLSSTQKGSRARKAQIEVTNLGNIRSRYELRATNPDDALRFQFLLNQKRLLERQMQAGSTGVGPMTVSQTRPVAPAEYVPSPSAPPPTTVARPMQPDSATASPQPSQGGGGGGFSNPLAGQGDRIKQVGAFGKIAGIVGEVLYSIAYVLPSFIATPIRTIAITLRRADQAGRRIEKGAKNFEKIQGEAGIAAGQAGGANGPSQTPRPPGPSQGGGGGGFSNPLAGQGDRIKQVGAFGKIAGIVGEVLYSIAYVLPSFIATPIRTIAITLRRADQAGRRIEKGAKNFEKIQGEAGIAAGQAGLTNDPPPAAAPSPQAVQPSPSQAAAAPQGAATMPPPSQPTGQPPLVATPAPPDAFPDSAREESAPPRHDHSLTPDAPIENWAETPFIQPGESLVVEVLIKAIRARRTQNHAFTITSRSVEFEEAPVVVEHGEVEIKKKAKIGRVIVPTVILAAFLFILMVVLTAGLFFVGVLAL